MDCSGQLASQRTECKKSSVIRNKGFYKSKLVLNCSVKLLRRAEWTKCFGLDEVSYSSFKT